MFLEHRTLGSAEDFVIIYIGMTAILVMLVRPFSQNLHSLFPRGLHIKFGLDWPSGFEKSCLKIMIIHMYIAPGQGKKTPSGQVFS